MPCNGDQVVTVQCSADYSRISVLVTNYTAEIDRYRESNESENALVYLKLRFTHWKFERVREDRYREVLLYMHRDSGYAEASSLVDEGKAPPSSEEVQKLSRAALCALQLPFCQGSRGK